jgi:hypothetical protein
MQKRKFNVGDRVWFGDREWNGPDPDTNSGIGGTVVGYDASATTAPNSPWRVDGYVSVQWDDGETESYGLCPEVYPGLANISKVNK